MNTLEIRKLSKRFDSKQVLKDVSFTVPEHCVFGFIGRNGAGKTTTMKSILGLLPVDSGEIAVCGNPVSYGKRLPGNLVGYLPDVPEFYGYMSAREYLSLCGEAGGMSRKERNQRSAELLELVGLAHEKSRIKGYSRGMKQRLGIAQALMSKPRLLICDEPTSALDPVGRKEILQLLSEVCGEASVLFSTHILSDVEKICDRIALLEKGEIRCSGTISEIRAMRADTQLDVIPAQEADIAKILEAFPAAAADSRTDAMHPAIVFRNASDVQAEEIMQFLVQQHIPVLRFERHEPDLEDLFMEVISK